MATEVAAASYTTYIDNHTVPGTAVTRRILIVTKVMTAYQYDLLDAISEINGVQVVFVQYGSGRNELFYNESGAELASRFQRAFSPKEIKTADLTDVIVGGHRSPLLREIIRAARDSNVAVNYWMERPMSPSLIKSLVRTFLHYFYIAKNDKVLAVDYRAQVHYKKYSDYTYRFPYSISSSGYTLAVTEDPEPKKIKYLFCGKLVERKNIVNLVLAFETLDSNKYSLTILGQGELLEELKYVAQGRNITSIKFLGQVPNSELKKIFSAHHMFVLPSNHDGWGVVVTEAMASGLYVIVSDKVGAADLLVGRDGGDVIGCTVHDIRNAIVRSYDNRVKNLVAGRGNADFIRSTICDSKKSADLLLKILSE